MFNEFFRRATGKPAPFDYQRRLAEEPWPDLLNVPTGLGKTAAVVLGWLWKRGWRGDGQRVEVEHDTPRRLIWCLPMRVLVEQTTDSTRGWLSSLGVLGEAGKGKVSVQVLMGGEPDIGAWAEHPEEDMILIGTQDMLLSRALMRGYGMSRYQWPVHYALLHNDAMWVYDEVQLMGAGLTTSTQLEAFRRSSFPLAKSSRSLWVSATLNKEWLETVDFKPHLDTLSALHIGDEDRKQAGDRLQSVKQLEKSSVELRGSSARDVTTYLQSMCDAVLEAHDRQAQTLVIVNRVDRAQGLFRQLQEKRKNQADLLVHARFRAAERSEQTRRLREEPSSDRIIVATQAIEAGVDISSKVLITELAPWASLVQRFGRCNRYGEHNGHGKDGGARILWVDISDDANVKPYETESLDKAREKLKNLNSASPQDLPVTDEARPQSMVLRRKDLLDLFNTDPDLSGFDVDVSDYIRDSDRPGVQVFWRDFADDPNQPHPQPKPERIELCPVSISQARDFARRKDVSIWHWDSLDECWTKLDRDPRPGMTLLLKAADGGYASAIGFDAGLKKPPVPVVSSSQSAAVPEHGYSEDWRSRQIRAIELPDHLKHVADQAAQLCQAVGEMSNSASVIRAARWHDVGKAHQVFQRTLHGDDTSKPPPYLAKSPSRARHKRKFFRHELASALAWLAQHGNEEDADLIAYLIAAHHGKVRMSLRAMPTERADAAIKRFARGVWEGDVLPALQFDNEQSATTELKLALMEIGEGEQGASWAARTLGLLETYGPFKLAWLETLVCVADWRASALEQLANQSLVAENPSHGLANSNSALAQPAAAGAAGDSACPPAAQSGAEHGLRGRAGGSTDAGGGTRPSHAATRFLQTSLGTLSYSELAPHLARRVEALQDSIGEGEFDDCKIDEDLFLRFHQCICGDLTPDFAGRWRNVQVVVGSHKPPAPHLVAQHMRDYTRNLAARIAHLGAEPGELLLETLAFAEGRLLSIHPFADFNGRVTRVFMDWLTRYLDLPDVDPTPDEGVATEQYLAALRAADQSNWQPLMQIWRERFETGAVQ